ncbi:MAG TPA: hypothetical protein VJH91_03525 [Candidatus Paceibacterota bacterium]
MTLDTLIMLSGAFVAVLPFLGLPNSWDSALYLIAGVFVISLGIVVRRRGKHVEMSRVIRESDFVENATRTHADAVGHEVH